ncbi:uncharacterized protein [Musca autumnalis]|uniref:uncharacterized protein n=1 Tax=Musca autumnalis TaxID=221902 RepID=UPI003CED80C2
MSFGDMCLQKVTQLTSYLEAVLLKSSQTQFGFVVHRFFKKISQIGLLDVTKPSLLTRWQRISFLKQQFWNMWSRDYLLSLQQRSKWFKEEENVKEGQLVVIHEDNTPPQQWLLARVTKPIPGRDGKIRVVELRTKNGSCCRPIHKIAPLPQQ